MNTSENLAGVMRRIAKLLAIAEDSRGDPNECAAAARMAESVMRKYQIDHAYVIGAELQRGGDDAFGSEDVGSTLNPEGYSHDSSGFAGILAVAVALLHDCQVRYTRTEKHGKTIRFSGYTGDAQMCRFTYIYLVDQMVRAAGAYRKTPEGKWAGRAGAEAFRRGFNSAVVKLLHDATRAKAADMQVASTSRDLVIVKSTAVAKHFGDIKYRKSAGHFTKQGEAYSRGRDEGSKVDVGRRGISHSGGSVGLIGS